MKKTFAEIYDSMMEYVDYDEWVRLIDKKISPFIKDKNILEIGCGTGEIVVRMQKKGYKVEAIDNSIEMLKLAKEKYKNIEFIKKDMRNLEYEEKFDAVISVFDTLNYLNSYDDLIFSLEGIKKSLKSKGVFLFDIITKKMLENMFPDGIFADDRDNMTILWKHREIDKLEEISTSFFIKEEENNYYRVDEVFMKKMFSMKKLDEIIEKTGFKLLKKELNEEIAGPRVIYLIQRVD